MSSSVQPLGAGWGPDPVPQGAADPAAKPVRRSFPAEYRARVVAEYEAAPHGEKSAVLRREGLYQSQIREWTAAGDAVARGLTAKRNSHHGPGKSGGPSDTDRSRAENARLTRELAISEIAGGGGDHGKTSRALCATRRSVVSPAQPGGT
jgi:transposase